MILKNTIKFAGIFIAILFSVLIISGYFVIRSPLAFQKSVVIKASDIDELLYVGNNGIDIEKLIGAIPYKNGGMIYEIEPELKFNKTIIKGYGNCSNLSYGLAFYLGKLNHKYNIIAFLHRNDFLDGVGHVVVQTTYKLEGENHSGIIDLLEGGLPKNGEKFLDLKDLIRGDMDNVLIMPFNDDKDDLSPYYGEFLNNSIIGVITYKEVEEYFDFLKSIYLPLGNKKLEKYIYDGIAILTGKYPYIYVNNTDYNILFKDKKHLKYLYSTFLYMLRFFIIFSLFLSAVVMYKKIK